MPEYGKIPVDAGFGGGFMAFINEEDLGIDIEKEDLQKLLKLGMTCKAAFLTQINCVHPTIPEVTSSEKGICMMIRKTPKDRKSVV